MEKTQKIYTLCGPRPASADRDTVTFENVKVMPTKEATSYDVCYCAFDCFDPSRWQRVPGALETEPAVTESARARSYILAQQRTSDTKRWSEARSGHPRCRR